MLVCTKDSMQVGDWACKLMYSASDDLLDPRTCDVIFPMGHYDLGMRTRRSVHKQLALDVPRSVVIVNDERTECADHVMKSTPHARFCTQAAFAPALEWLLSERVIVKEPSPSSPVTVYVHSSGEVSSRKRLTVCGLQCERDLHITVRTCAASVVVELVFGGGTAMTEQSETALRTQSRPTLE